MSDELQAWRRTHTVRQFSTLTRVVPGGLLRFDDVAPGLFNTLLAGAPGEITEQASDNGPHLVAMVDLAERLDGSLGGFLSADDRDDVVLICDTLLVPATTDQLAVLALGADDVSTAPDGRLCLWWD